jgi:antitoxin VapB
VSATAKLFRHGRSQAVRLPKDYRLEGAEVHVAKVGDRVILQPLATRHDPGAFWAAVDAAGDVDFMLEGREQPAMPTDRVVFEE